MTSFLNMAKKLTNGYIEVKLLKNGTKYDSEMVFFLK